MNWASKRQLFYLAVFLFAVLLFSAVFIFPHFKKAATCFDGKQNGTETGVDCGGSCEAACFFEANDISIRWVRAFPVSSNVYNVLAYAENQNANLGVKSISYEFDLYDADNVFIARRTGSTFVGPNSTVAIFEAGIDVGNRTPKRTSFSFLEDPKWVNIDPRTEKLPIFITGNKFSNLDTGPKLDSAAENDSIYNISNLDIIAVIYDAAGNAIGISKTLLDALPKNSTQKIFFTWPAPFAAKPEKIEIIPRVNVFSIDF